MQKMTATKKIVLGAFAAALVAPLYANAAVYVIDDPIQIKPAVIDQRTPFEIPFYKNRNALGPQGKASMAALLIAARAADAIEITGRPDATNQSSLSLLRAYVLRDYLTANGIDPAIITLTTADTHPQQSNVFASTIVIKRKQNAGQTTNIADSRSVRESLPLMKPSASDDQNEGIKTQSTTGATSLLDMKMAFVQRILKMAKAGTITSDDAIKILNELINSPSPAAKTKAAAIDAANTPVGHDQFNKAEQITVNKWVLSANKTLRQNLDDWAKLAGWKPVVWDIPSDFNVTYSSVLDGEFLTVLEKVSTAANLDFYVSKNAKEIRVSMKK